MAKARPAKYEFLRPTLQAILSKSDRFWLAHQILAKLRTDPRFRKTRADLDQVCQRAPRIGQAKAISLTLKGWKAVKKEHLNGAGMQVVIKKAPKAEQPKPSQNMVLYRWGP